VTAADAMTLATGEEDPPEVERAAIGRRETVMTPGRKTAAGAIAKGPTASTPTTRSVGVTIGATTGATTAGGTEGRDEEEAAMRRT